jgi:hypothetical protein
MRPWMAALGVSGPTRGTTGLGSWLRSSFHAASNGKRGEIDLFRALLQTFRIRKDALVEEFHGAKSHVIFDAKRGAGRPKPRCELADLLLIAYRASEPRSARLTWLQAKVTDSDLSCRRSMSSPPSFTGNLEQWDLLANRPLVRGPNRTFQPPDNLLSAAALPSVGSFGVFYPVGAGFEMAYFVADCLRPRQNNPSSSGTLQFLGPGPIRTVGPLCEVTSTCCLEASATPSKLVLSARR